MVYMAPYLQWAATGLKKAAVEERMEATGPCLRDPRFAVFGREDYVVMKLCMGGWHDGLESWDCQDHQQAAGLVIRRY